MFDTFIKMRLASRMAFFKTRWKFILLLTTTFSLLSHLVLAQSADLQMIKSDNPDPVVPEAALSYTLLVLNNGPDTSSGVVVTDTVPSEVTIVSVTSVASCSTSGLTVTCNLGDIENGQIIAVVIFVTAPNFETTLSNTAQVISNTDDPDPANNTATIQTGIILPPTNSGCTLSSETPTWDATLVLAGLFLAAMLGIRRRFRI